MTSGKLPNFSVPDSLPCETRLMLQLPQSHEVMRHEVMRHEVMQTEGGRWPGLQLPRTAGTLSISSFGVARSSFLFTAVMQDLCSFCHVWSTLSSVHLLLLPQAFIHPCLQAGPISCPALLSIGTDTHVHA